MELDRPGSRGGPQDPRPVTRWRREERPPSRSGLTEDSSRFTSGGDRPISRRGIKPETSYQVSLLLVGPKYLVGGWKVLVK